MSFVVTDDLWDEIALHLKWTNMISVGNADVNKSLNECSSISLKLQILGCHW